LITESIILAGGLGTRLRDTVPDLPKCMAPVSGKPFLSYVIDYFKRQGVAKFIFALGYKHEAIETYLKTQDIDFDTSIEEEPLGTGGAIKLACSKTSDENVLVLNGDTFFGISLSELDSFHRSKKSNCSIVLKPMKNFDRYGCVFLNDDQSIQRFEEKKFQSKGLINGGIYCLQKSKFINENLPEKFSFENDYLEKFHDHRPMFGCVQDRYFIDIGIPEDYRRAQTELLINT